ncbi:MAG: amidohydrolase family protein [Anaerolineales bacterium]|jgi:predicted TIM-barrel fold metal-dependent hydrolase
MIIDSHTHVDLVEAWGWMDPPEIILDLMDEAGVDKAVIMAYRDAIGPDDQATEYVRQAVEKYKQRLIGYVRINPNASGAMDALDQAISDFKMKGLKLHPVSYVGFPYKEATLRLMQRAAQYHAPILFHTGDEAMALPDEVAQAARLVPEATVIMAHLGGYFHYDSVLDIADSLPNVYVDTSAIPYPWVIRMAVDAFGPERVLYASDGPGCLPKLEIEKIRMAGLSTEEQELVFSGNLQRILNEVRHDI